jgi:hypothetical protein
LVRITYRIIQNIIHSPFSPPLNVEGDKSYSLSAFGGEG